MSTKSAKTPKTVEESTVDTAATESGAATAATGGAKARRANTSPRTHRPRQKAALGDREAESPRKTRTDTKQAKLIAMLEAKDGTTVAEIAAAFGWQAHTVRGALYGALKKKLGLDVTSEKVDGKGRVYRIGS